MPMLKIFTNLQKVQIPADFLPKILPVLAKCVNKPVERFSVAIATDCVQSVNGDSVAPSILASLESIGNLGPAENRVIVKDVTELIEKELGVHRDRVIITFYDLKATDVGKGGVLAN